MPSKKKGDLTVATSQTGFNYSNMPKPDPHIPKRKSENDLLLYAIMSVAVLILSLTAPLVLSGSTYATAVAWAACAISATLVVLTSKNFFSIFAVSLVFVFCLSYLGDPVLLAITAGAVFSCGLYSAAVTAANKSHIFFLIAAPLLPIPVVYLITGDVALSLLSIAHLPAALAMGIATRKSVSRTHAVAIFAAVASLTVIAFTTAHIYMQNGTVTKEIIADSAEYLRGGIKAFLDSALKSADPSRLEGSMLLNPGQTAVTAVNLLPAILVIITSVAGFFSQRVQRALFNTCGKDKLYEKTKENITVSCTAALLYLAAHLLSFTTSPSNSVSFIGTVSQNLSFMLLPALVCVGFRAVAGLPRKIGFLAIAAWIGIVIIANSLSTSLLTILALFGASSIILVRVDAWAKDHYAKKGEGQ